MNDGGPQILQKCITTKNNGTISYFEYTSILSASTSSPPHPGLIIVHGALESSRSHSEIASILCSSFTVFLPDRRGRGGSSAPGADFSMQTEIDDLEALLLATGARYVAGVSSGAMITLYSALALLSTKGNGEGLIKKIVVFEPPLLLDDFPAFERAKERIEREIEEGKIADAFITEMRITQMANWVMAKTPRWALVPLVRWGLRWDEKRNGAGEGVGKKVEAGGDGSEYTVARLVPTVKFDFQLVKEVQGTLERLKSLNEMNVDVLLMSASKSPGWLRRSTEELERLIPKASHVRLQGVDHLALGNRDIAGGRPEQAAAQVTKFLNSK
ncbi:alpha/beta-hydrolase [Stipitochalara longipes BDJ]|nr:alpha/beta-hydrolase [Stipitochalara longipes BDJ]